MLETRIPPPVYALSIALLMWGLAAYVPVLEWLPHPWNRAGLLVMGMALLVDFWSLWLFFRARTTPNPLRPDRTRQLVTQGLYRYTRNPMYVGLLVMLAGWALYLGKLSPLLLLPVFVWIIERQQILPEEAVLQAKFGQAYRDYQQRVPRWLW